MNQVTVDRLTLAAALLDTAKAQLRVRHTRDDALIQNYVAMAIEAVERRCGINLNPAVFDLDVYALQAAPITTGWSPFLPYVMGWPPLLRVALPVNNIHAFTLLDADGVDQSAGYTTEQADLGGSASAYLVGAPVPAAGWTMTADVGVDTAEALAPAVLAAVLRLTGGYYEARESFSALTVDDFLGELATVWRPSA